MWVVCDIETNRLENPDKIWCIVCKDINTGEVHKFVKPFTDSPEAERFKTFAKGVDVWIGHYFLGFDYKWINHLIVSYLCNVIVDPNKVIDTLIVARLAAFADWNNEEQKPVTNIHSLEAWGERFQHPKIHLDISFEEYSDAILERCINDVELTEKIFNFYRKYILDEQNAQALWCEHQQQLICTDIHDNGFYFNIDYAKETYADIISRLGTLATDLQVSFPPTSKLIREINPRATKHGTISRVDFRWEESGDLTAYNVGSPFSRFEWVSFNPASSKDRIEVLNDAGWNPTEKTDSHVESEKQFRKNPSPELEEKLARFRIYGWKTSEENLQTLPDTAPESAKTLVKWLLLNGRRLKLEEWFRAYNDKTHRIHGTYIPIGAWTQRKAHTNPNQANVPSIDSKYNGKDLKELAREFGIKLRSCFTVPERRRLIGTDADGIQARIFAHYINDPDFIKALIEGNSKDATDIHSRHYQRLSPICKSRADAKTFYYAWLLGAGVSKVGNIFGCSNGEAKQAIDIFLDIYPGLGYLKQVVIPQDAANGYFKGFDGRLVPCPSEYRMLAGYLQNGETVIMKHAQIRWRDQLRREGIWFLQVNDVHDEWQTEAEDDLDLCNYIGKVQADSIRTVAEDFKLNCPFAGNYKIGLNWYETH